MSFFDLNRKISYEHININKTSTKKWYEQLGATSSTLYAYGTTENEVEYYNAGKKLYKTFDCIKLNGDATLNFSSVFSNSDIENNYIFLKYYYVKYYYYDSEWDRPIYRWKYSSINEQTIDSGYTTILGNAIKLAADKSFLLPKGEYSLKGWEIVKISKEAVSDYFYADGTYKIGCSADKNNKVKDNLNINKVIDSKYVTDAADYGNYAFYSIPSYAINNKNIRVFGDLDKSDNTGNYWNKNGIKYYYNDSTNKEISFGSSVNSQYFREADPILYPIILFNDFGWQIEDIPSSTNPLQISLNEDKTSVTVSFKGETKKYALKSNDEIVLYARPCKGYCDPPQIYYGYLSSNQSFFTGTLKNDSFTFELNPIHMYKFYDFIDNNNNFILKDTIDINKNEFSNLNYRRIITNLEDEIISISNNYAYDGIGLYDKRIIYTPINFFFATFNYNKIYNQYLSGSIYSTFNYESINDSYGPVNSSWKMYFQQNDKELYEGKITEGKIEENKLNKIRKIIITNNQTILNDAIFRLNAATYRKNSISYTNKTLTYEDIFTNLVQASVGTIRKGTYETYWYGRDITKDTGGVVHDTELEHNIIGKPVTILSDNIILNVDHSLSVNTRYTSANVDQPAIAIVLWTSHEEH